MARGLGPHVGSFEKAAVNDITDGDAFQAPPTILTGSADAINPHASGNYIVTTAGVDAMTLGLPSAGVDDNLSIAIYSGSSNAHTVTLPSAQFANGAALATVATFKANSGSGVVLRAWNGSWQVLASNVTSIS
jgi:hypothetical protein